MELSTAFPTSVDSIGRRHLALLPSVDVHAFKQMVDQGQLCFGRVLRHGPGQQQWESLSGVERFVGCAVDYANIRVALRGQDCPWEQFPEPPALPALPDG